MQLTDIMESFNQSIKETLMKTLRLKTYRGYFDSGNFREFKAASTTDAIAQAQRIAKAFNTTLVNLTKVSNT